jgi:hypothetical protein
VRGGFGRAVSDLNVAANSVLGQDTQTVALDAPSADAIVFADSPAMCIRFYLRVCGWLIEMTGRFKELL